MKQGVERTSESFVITSSSAIDDGSGMLSVTFTSSIYSVYPVSAGLFAYFYLVNVVTFLSLDWFSRSSLTLVSFFGFDTLVYG